MPFDGSATEVESEDIQRLRAMERLLSSPDAWCKGAYDKGTRHCLVGAFISLLEIEFVTLYVKLGCVMTANVYKGMTWLAKSKGYQGVEDFNDCPNTTHDDILAFLAELRQKWPSASKKSAHLHFA